MVSICDDKIIIDLLSLLVILFTGTVSNFTRVSLIFSVGEVWKFNEGLQFDNATPPVRSIELFEMKT